MGFKFGVVVAGGASAQSFGKAPEAAAPVIPQEKARLAASLFGDSGSAESRVRRSPNKQVGYSGLCSIF